MIVSIRSCFLFLVLVVIFESLNHCRYAEEMLEMIEQLEDRLYIYLEYASGGSIHKLLQEYGAFKEPVIRNYTRQILQGLAYLHNQNTVHRYPFQEHLCLNFVAPSSIARLTCNYPQLYKSRA